MTDAFLLQLYEQLAQMLHTRQFHLTPLQGGASSRRYVLIDLEQTGYFPSTQVVLMWVPPAEREIIDQFMHIGFYLERHKVPIPRIYEINQRQGWAFLEYIPAPTLAEHLQRAPDQLSSLVNRALDFLIELQTRCQPEPGNPAFQRFFDREKFMFEFQFHVRQKLLQEFFQISLSSSETKAFQMLSETVSEVLHCTEPFFIHRDFQSSNLFYCPEEAQGFKLIDFQDARAGLPLYDVVSLLWDSYLPVPPALRNSLLQRYRQFFQQHFYPLSSQAWQQRIDFLVIQRKLHDAGAFANNYLRFQNRRYLRYIGPALAMACQAMAGYPEFASMQAFFTSLSQTQRLGLC